MEKLLKISERNKFEVRGLLPDETAVNRLANYFQNLADSTRLKILSALSIRDLCVNDLSNVLQINQTTISHGLKALKNLDMISFRREGKILVYSIKSQNVNELLSYAVCSILNWFGNAITWQKTVF